MESRRSRMTEFRVEITPGRELLYRTHLALRAAIRSREITADSRIFHRATSTWVPITEHPEFRKVQAELQPPPWLDPSPPPPLVVPPPAVKKRRFLRHLADMGAALKERFDSDRSKRTTPAKPAATLKPASSIRPGQPAPPTEQQSSDPTRPRWTFYP